MSTTENFNSGGKIIQTELFNPSGTPNGGAIIIAFRTHGMLEHWGSEVRAYAKNNKVIGNPLCIQYWSTTPCKLGSHFIKFSVKSHEIEATPRSIPDSPNYLHPEHEPVGSINLSRRKIYQEVAKARR